MLATEYANYYKIEAQREGESDAEFRSRVSGTLRDMGKLIEAHEAFNDTGKLLKAPKREDNAAALLSMLLMMQRD